jgi:hypothetical protein
MHAAAERWWIMSANPAINLRTPEADVLPPVVEKSKPSRKRRQPLPPLMVDAKRSARLFSVGLRTWRALDAAEKVPLPTKLGARVLWNLPKLRRRAAAGCPDRLSWERIKLDEAIQRKKRG